MKFALYWFRNGVK